MLRQIAQKKGVLQGVLEEKRLNQYGFDRLTDPGWLTPSKKFCNDKRRAQFAGCRLQVENYRLTHNHNPNSNLRNDKYKAQGCVFETTVAQRKV